jgi:phosphate transport system substrate-binding protein
MALLQLFSKTAVIVTFFVSFFSYADEQKLVLTGSSTVAPLALEIGKRFESLNPGVLVDVQSGGSSRGVADARSGLANIGMASRALNDKEQDLQAHTIALDGIAIIVHAKNKISTLSDEQIKAIYTGKITNWKELGGANKPITVINKAEGRSTLELFLARFGLDNKDIKASVVIGDNQQGIKTVVGNPNSIAYVSIGTAEFEAGQGSAIKLLPMAGIEASVAQVQAGKFPLSRPLNLITLTKPEGLVKRFIDFAQSDAVRDLIAEQFFVPVNLVPVNLVPANNNAAKK